MEIRRIQNPPENIDQFVEAILPEYEQLYGKAAAAAYRITAPAQLLATIAHPTVRAYAAMESSRALALLFVRATETRHILSFFHILQGHNSSSCGPALLNFMVSDIAENDGRVIISEYIPLCPLDLDAAYQELGFHQVDRQIMRKICTGTLTSTPDGYEICTATKDDMGALADVLSAAYAKHPEHLLYEEVQSGTTVLEFLNQCAAGLFGSCPRDYMIGAWEGTTCVGLIVGTEVVAEMGFVLHMAVLPEHQGCGVGTGLLGALTTRFYDHGMTYAALGVTRDNPAAHLYAKADFETVQPFAVYYRVAPRA
jgi:GNAT superfamily N-acetyltransferase